MARGNAVGVGIIGFGTIGTGVVRVLAQHAAQIRARLGRPVRVVRIADLDLTSDRGVRIPAGALTNDARALIADPHVDVVVELIGGTEPARTFHAEAIAAGKPVVSASTAPTWPPLPRVRVSPTVWRPASAVVSRSFAPCAKRWSAT